VKCLNSGVKGGEKVYEKRVGEGVSSERGFSEAGLEQEELRMEEAPTANKGLDGGGGGEEEREEVAED
jgi:hypothetical protein